MYSDLREGREEVRENQMDVACQDQGECDYICESFMTLLPRLFFLLEHPSHRMRHPFFFYRLIKWDTVAS